MPRLGSLGCSAVLPQVLHRSRAGHPTAGGAWGAVLVACGSVASFPPEFLTHIPARPPPPPARSQQLPSRAPAEQTQGIHAIPTPPPPHTHTQSRVNVHTWCHSCRGPVLGFGCPASAPSSVTAPSFSVGAALLHPQTMRFWVPMLLGHWEAWSVSTVNPELEGSRPRVCLTSPHGVCRAGTAV